MYSGHLFDGKMSMQYGYNLTSRVPKGQGSITQKGSPQYKEATTGEKFFFTRDNIFWGYLNYEVDRVDAILRTAPSLSLAMGKGELTNCYVVSGKARTGQYTIWLDPEHDYQIARAEVKRREGDFIALAARKPTTKGFKVDVVIKDVKFEKFGTSWLPVSATIDFDEDLGQGGEFSGFLEKATIEIKRVSVKLNPDFETLHSFVPDDVLEGASIVLNTGNGSVHCTWHDGKPVPKR